jgi:cbb3-type cytochrome oxidase subunit 1
MKSYSVYAGVQDALVQCGMVITRIFSTTPFRIDVLFRSKSGKSSCIFRLSIVFWSLILFISGWGPHHLYILLYLTGRKIWELPPYAISSFLGDDKWFTLTLRCLG